jgi:hypothetical protein
VNPKVKGRVLGIYVLYDTFLTILLCARLLRCLWLNLCALGIIIIIVIIVIIIL